MPNCIGSPVASTQTRRPRIAATRSDERRERRRPGEPLAPSAGTMARCRSPPISTAAVSTSVRAAGDRPATRPRRCRSTESHGVMRASAEDQRIQGGGRHGAAAAPPVQRDEGHAEPVPQAPPSIPPRRRSRPESRGRAPAVPAPAATSSSRRKSAVGALPITTTAPLRLPAESSMPAAARVCPLCAARSAAPGHSIEPRRALRRLSGSAIRRPAATILTSQRIVAPATSAARPRAPLPSSRRDRHRRRASRMACTIRRGHRRDVGGRSLSMSVSSATVWKERRVISVGSRM